MIRLGYAGKNVTLASKSKTTRLATIQKMEIEQPGTGLAYAKSLLLDNLAEIYDIIAWNIGANIKFFRLPSDIAPHATDPALIADKHNWRCLAYSFYDLLPHFRRIGNLAKRHDMRLTFHPDPFVVINSPNPDVVTRSLRDLYMHVLFLEYLGLDTDSVLVLHGGGVYDDKRQAAARWIAIFRSMPEFMRKRIVIENDETNYSIDDVLNIAEQVRIPVVLDIFHYQCYEIRAKERGLKRQTPLPQILPAVVATWGERTVKMHISQQKPNAAFGAHDDYVEEIPRILRDFPKKYHRDLDLMVEAKMKELAVLKLMLKA